MIFFRYIYRNLHNVLKQYTIDDDSARIMGSSSLFTSATLFWFLSIYTFCSEFMGQKSPMLDVNFVGLVFIISVGFSIYIVFTTKGLTDTKEATKASAMAILPKIISLSYLIGSFILFFGYALE